MSSSCSNAAMEMSAPLISGIVSNVLFYFSPHIDQTLPQVIHILHFCLVDSLLTHAADFVVNCIEVRAATNLQ